LFKSKKPFISAAGGYQGMEIHFSGTDLTEKAAGYFLPAAFYQEAHPAGRPLLF